MIESLSGLPRRPLFSSRSPYDFDADDPRGLRHLSLEQQEKRARELLKHWRAGNADALDRARCALPAKSLVHPDSLALSDAQHVIAHEHRFGNWAEFISHIEHARMERQAVEQGKASALDAEQRTLHIRCGTDIQHALSVAGFCGDFMSFADPYVQGPVPATGSIEDFIKIRAAFLAEAHYAPRAYELLTRDHADLARARDYPRVALWFEHDSHDQIILARLLHYFSATARRPKGLQFISVTHFPGVKRFNGIGQLPPEAMRVLWRQFTEVDQTHLALGHAAWEAITAAAPESLLRLVEQGTGAIPTMAIAFRRHLQELPSRQNGLSLTEQLTLRILRDKGPMNAARLFGRYTNHYEPLPFLGDTGYWLVVDGLAEASHPAIHIEKNGDKPVDWQVELTRTGDDLLGCRSDWVALNGIQRWVGGVLLDSGRRAVWRYDPGLGLFREPG